VSPSARRVQRAKSSTGLAFSLGARRGLRFDRNFGRFDSDARTHRTPTLRAKSNGGARLFFATAFGVRTRPRVAFASEIVELLGIRSCKRAKTLFIAGFAASF